jgi:hypothetical protein
MSYVNLTLYLCTIGQLGNADIIQPGLMQLQPSLDDFMDTLEPLPSLNGLYIILCYMVITPSNMFAYILKPCPREV